MDLLITQLFLNIICRVYTKSIRNAFAPVEFTKSSFDVTSISDLYIVWERWIGKNIYTSFLLMSMPLFL